MKRILILIVNNVDVVVALVMAVLFGLLDVVGSISTAKLDGATVITLGALAAGMLHNRIREESGESRLREHIAEQLSMVNLVDRFAERYDVWQLIDMFEDRYSDGSVRMLNGAEISRELQAARETSTLWDFKGGTGTFVRAVTLPSMAERARKGRQHCEVRLELIDPRDTQLCKAYASYFSKLEPPAAGPDPDSEAEAGWTWDGTRREVLATILAACWYQYWYTDVLDVSVWLSANLSSLRWEVAQDRLIVTHRGPQFPALLFTSENKYFNILGNEMRVGRARAHRLGVKNAVDRSTLSKRPTVAEVRELFKKLDVPLPAEYTDENVASIIGQSLHAPDPYLTATTGRAETRRPAAPA